MSHKSRYSLDELLHLVKRYHHMSGLDSRKAHLVEEIKYAIKSLADHGTDVETLAEKDVELTSANIIHGLNPNLTEEQRHVAEPKPRLTKKNIFLEIYKLQVRNVMNMTKAISQALIIMNRPDFDPENEEALINQCRRHAAKLFFAIQRLVPKEQRIKTPERVEDIYSAGVRISKLVLDNADNYMGFTKMGPGLGGPLGQGPSGKILHDIPDIIDIVQRNLNHQQPEQRPFHPTPFPDPFQIPGAAPRGAN